MFTVFNMEDPVVGGYSADRIALRLLTAYMPMKAHVHRIRLRLSQPWVNGYQPHPFSNNYWRFIDSQPPYL